MLDKSPTPDEALEKTSDHSDPIESLSAKDRQNRHAELKSQIRERTQMLALAQDQLLEIAVSDRLTQLPNRLSFAKQLSKAMAKAQLQAKPERHTKNEASSHFAVLFLDCDRFKRINDSLGHRTGDQLLKMVAQRLLNIQNSHHSVDTIARFGGDEFALLVTKIADKAAVTKIANKVLGQLSLPFRLAEREIFMSASIGIVWGDTSYAASEHILRDADVAMYQAKESSRSQYHWFESEMHNRAVQMLQLETDLHLALKRREFELYYQPIVDLEQLKVSGFEALVRWNHPTRGLLLPGEFIEFAEESGFITRLGKQVLEMACADIAQWIEADALDLETTVSVNIAAQQLLQPDILEQIYSIVEASGIPPYRLRLELTERSILNNHDFANEVLQSLQRHSIRLSIDDFGIGYSALSYLHTLPVSCLKIDRAFVQPITDAPDSLGIVPLIINIAKTMNMQVVAEGIENLVQLRQLQRLGCLYGQGFLFQRAMPAHSVIALLKDPFDPAFLPEHFTA